jgi:hypothetical protein
MILYSKKQEAAIVQSELGVFSMCVYDVLQQTPDW